MPHLNTWVIAERVMLTDVWGVVTPEEFMAYDIETMENIAPCTAGLVHTLYRMEQVESLPGPAYFTTMTVSHHPLLGYSCVVGIHSRVVRLLLMAAAGAAGSRLSFHDTLASAVRFLVEADPSVAALSTVDLAQVGRAGAG
jgi:hypothetical protein